MSEPRRRGMPSPPFVPEDEKQRIADFLSRVKPWGTPTQRPVCPECGPHGNSGKVLLLDTWVDCLTCRETKR